MVITELWVMPSSAPAESGGVMRMPLRAAKMFSPVHSATRPFGRQHDRFVVAGLERLDLGQRRVGVVARRLRRRRHGVVVVARPGADLHADALRHRVVAQVRAPRPAGDGDVDRAGQRVEPHLAVAVVRDRPDVAARESGRRDGVLGGLDDLLHRVGDVHPDDLRRVEQPHDVVGEAEHGRALRGLVGADPLEHAGAVVEGVREDVDARRSPSRRARRSSRSWGGRDRHEWSSLNDRCRQR